MSDILWKLWRRATRQRYAELALRARASHDLSSLLLAEFQQNGRTMGITVVSVVLQKMLGSQL